MTTRTRPAMPAKLRKTAGIHTAITTTPELANPPEYKGVLPEPAISYTPKKDFLDNFTENLYSPFIGNSYVPNLMAPAAHFMYQPGRAARTGNDNFKNWASRRIEESQNYHPELGFTPKEDYSPGWWRSFVPPLSALDSVFNAGMAAHRGDKGGVAANLAVAGLEATPLSLGASTTGLGKMLLSKFAPKMVRPMLSAGAKEIAAKASIAGLGRSFPVTATKGGALTKMLNSKWTTWPTYALALPHAYYRSQFDRSDADRMMYAAEDARQSQEKLYESLRKPDASQAAPKATDNKAYSPAAVYNYLKGNNYLTPLLGGVGLGLLGAAIS